MTVLLALALAAAPTAVDAERDFARMAQTEGQWTAFRAYAADDAVVFNPHAANAQQEYTGRADPQFAVMWWPAASYVSCDGASAVNTGPWSRPGASHGYFTTIWQQQSDGGWKWLLDHGDALETPRPAPDEPESRRAACPRGALPAQAFERPADAVEFGEGASPDSTLRWSWMVRANGSRRVEALLYDGEGFDRVLLDEIGVGG